MSLMRFASRRRRESRAPGRATAPGDVGACCSTDRPSPEPREAHRLRTAAGTRQTVTVLDFGEDLTEWSSASRHRRITPSTRSFSLANCGRPRSSRQLPDAPVADASPLQRHNDGLGCGQALIAARRGTAGQSISTAGSRQHRLATLGRTCSRPSGSAYGPPAPARSMVAGTSDRPGPQARLDDLDKPARRPGHRAGTSQARRDRSRASTSGMPGDRGPPREPTTLLGECHTKDCTVVVLATPPSDFATAMTLTIFGVRTDPVTIPSGNRPEGRSA